jgi:hypothetical protein
MAQLHRASTPHHVPLEANLGAISLGYASGVLCPKYEKIKLQQWLMEHFRNPNICTYPFFHKKYRTATWISQAGNVLEAQ